MFVGVADCRVVDVRKSVGKSGDGTDETATRSRSGKAGRLFGPLSVNSTRYVSCRSPTVHEDESSVNEIRLVAVGDVVVLVNRSSRRLSNSKFQLQKSWQARHCCARTVAVGTLRNEDRKSNYIPIEILKFGTKRNT